MKSKYDFNFDLEEIIDAIILFSFYWIILESALICVMIVDRSFYYWPVSLILYQLQIIIFEFWTLKLLEFSPQLSSFYLLYFTDAKHFCDDY